jgi:hypothetical protein
MAKTPLGADDGGFIAPDAATLKCEDGVAKASSKLVGGIFKCQAAQASASQKAASSQDDDTCESAAKTKYDLAVGKLTNCPPCLHPDAIRDSGVSQINGLANAALYCAGTVPYGGDDQGLIPPDAGAAKCENAAVKAVSKLTGGLVKCHIKQADASFKLLSPQDDDVCEGAAITKFNLAAAKLTNTTCPTSTCVVALLPTVGAAAEGPVDAMNGQTYCASPSGAFIE